MKPINTLWTERIRANNQEIRKYLRYMLNDHLLFVLIFGIGGGAFYYQKWVAQLDESFPVGWMMALILGTALTISPVQTLLKEADQVFLIPLETKMKSYFQKGIWTSFFKQSYVLLILLAILMPIYVQVKGEGFQTFFYLFVPLLLLKIWNLFIHWFMLKFQEIEYGRLDYIVRFLLNVICLFFIIESASFWLIGFMGIICILLFVYFSATSGKKLIKWDKLIKLEEQRMMTFYRIANLFTDVPKLKGAVKRRKWLDFLLQLIPYSQKNSYQFLYARTFIRNTEYFGLYVRLTFIGGILLYFSHNLYVIIGLAILFLYLTGFQLIPLIGSQDNKIWIHIYPLKNEWKKKSFLWLMLLLIFLQTSIFFIVLVVNLNWRNSIFMLMSGIIFTLLFVNLYIPARLKKMERQ